MDNPFEPLPGTPSTAADHGEPSISAREIAQQAAREAIGTSQPGTRFIETLPSEESLFPLQSDSEVPADETPAEPVETAPPAVAPVGLTADEYAELQSLGIDIPIAPEDVPAEFKDSYAALTQTIVDVHAAAQERVLDAQEAILRVKDFADRLNTPEGQQRFLLGMAMNSPDTFAEAVKTVSRMQDDPEYAETMRRRLEADVRYEAATRKETAMRDVELQQKGRQIESRTVRMAERQGVDVDLAKQMVASRILQNEAQRGKRDISLQEVDQIVSYLAQKSGGPRPAVKSPATQQAQRTAPTKPAGQTGRETPAPNDRAAAPHVAVPTHVDPRDSLRSAIREASIRARSSGL